MASFINKWLFGTQAGERPDRPPFPRPSLAHGSQPGQKRKLGASDVAGGSKPKARKIVNPPDFSHIDFYETTRESHDRRAPRTALNRSLDAGGSTTTVLQLDTDAVMTSPGMQNALHTLKLKGVDPQSLEDTAAAEVALKLKRADSKQERREVMAEIMASPTESLRTLGAASKRVGQDKDKSKGKADEAVKRPLTWEDNPNEMARIILRKSGNKIAAKKQICAAPPKEPLYSMLDVEIRDGLWKVLDGMERFAKEHFDFTFPETDVNAFRLVDAFASLKPETVMVIGCVGSGGPKGEDGWCDLFYDNQKRRALVCAIIGNTISQQVYQHIFFGGSAEDVKHLLELQKQNAGKDGFDRNRLTGEWVSENIKYGQHGLGILLPPEFEAHVSAVVKSILVHLSVFEALKDSPNDDLKIVAEDLYELITQAGILSLVMRADAHTVYYHTPVYKEDNFRQKDMECFNRKEMEGKHPRERTKWPESMSEAEKSRSKGDEPLTQMVIMDGVTTYRRGGWETAFSTPEKPNWEPGMANKGMRSRTLCHSWVYCRWGRARAFKDGKPADEPKAHGEQWQGGFMEFRDVPGVPEPTPESKGKGKKKA